jgi:small GTP-binding protein
MKMKIKGQQKDKAQRIKFLVLGESTIGKSCLIERYINNTFKENYIATIGMDIRQKRLDINNIDVFLTINDTAGQERFRSLTKMVYKNTDGILVGFDLTKPKTLEQVEFWINQIESNKTKDSSVSLVLFGNKCDMKEEIQVKEEDIEKIKEKYNLRYYETSAKDGTNVQNIFEYLAKIVLKSRGFLENVNIDEINVEEKELQKIETKKPNKKNGKKKCFK